MRPGKKRRRGGENGSYWISYSDMMAFATVVVVFITMMINRLMILIDMTRSRLLRTHLFYLILFLMSSSKIDGNLLFLGRK